MSQLDRIELMLTQVLQEIQALKAIRLAPTMQSHMTVPLAPVRGFFPPEAQGGENESWLPPVPMGGL